MNDISKLVAVGVIEACASTICDQIRIARIDASSITPQQRMTLACLMDQLKRITTDITTDITAGNGPEIRPIHE